MIYLDSAATSFIKPPSVYKTLNKMTRYCSANAGHGASTLSVAAAGYVYDAAEQAALLFNIPTPENIAFTPNTTLGLNMAIKGVAGDGAHVIMTSMEHNSVTRPVYACGTNYSVIRADENGFVNPCDIENEIQADTALVVVNHVSNVCGAVQNIDAIGEICRRHGVLFLVDAAQSAGVIDIDTERQNIDMLAFAGHKSLMGPLGTGGLYVRDGVKLCTIIEGGSGSNSESRYQSDEMPDRLVSGTMNMPAIAALGEGIRFVRTQGTDQIREHERFLRERFTDGLKNIDAVTIHGADGDDYAGVVSINMRGKSCVELASILDSEYKIAVRGGLHCAPLAHETIGTLSVGGTVRFSFGYYTKTKDIDYALYALDKICIK